jgi:Meiotically up-regulated gene 113
MPGYAKVGMSSRLAEDRARELGTTGVPEQFAVVHRMATSFPLAVERRAHAILAEHRPNPAREFFTVQPEQAIAAVQTAALQVAGIDAWTFQDVPNTISSGDRVAMTLRAGQVFIVLPRQERSLSDVFRGVGSPESLDIWQAHSDGDLLELMATEMPERVSGFSLDSEAGYNDPVPFLTRDNAVSNGALIGKERLHPGDRLLWMEQQGRLPNGFTPVRMALFQFASYCQVTCRTWDPRISPEGCPLILNAPTEDPTPTMIDVTRKALKLPCMELEQRYTRRTAEEAIFASVPDEPEYWLRQLRQGPARR